MYYVNLSLNGRVSMEGLNYTHVYLEDGITHMEGIEIPFVGFQACDFLDLPSGNLILLAPFDAEIQDSGLVLSKSYDNKNMVLVMYSIPWFSDGFLAEVLGGRPPETVLKFKTGHVSDTFYHEYLIFLHRGVEYIFGYYAEASQNSFVVSMYWGAGTDELVVKYHNSLGFI